MERVRFGIIGYGIIAREHAKAIKAAAGADLISVCGRDEKKREAFASEFGISARCDVFEMVKYDHIDAVVIATPHPLHHDQTLEALDAGCHVLVEKPMALTVAEATDMIIAAEKAGKVLSVVSQRRWYPSNMRIRDAIDGGKLGTPILAQLSLLGWRGQAYYESAPWRGTWDMEGGGILINQAPHLLDLLHWFLGPVSSVYGQWSNFNHPYIEVEDSAVATVNFESGALASILVSNSQNPDIHRHIHICGSTGAVVSSTYGFVMETDGKRDTFSVPVNDIWTLKGEADYLSDFQEEDREFFASIDPETYFFTRQIEDVVHSIVRGTDPLVRGEDGRETMKIIEGIYESGRSCAPVSFS